MAAIVVGAAPGGEGALTPGSVATAHLQDNAVTRAKLSAAVRAELDALAGTDAALTDDIADLVADLAAEIIARAAAVNAEAALRAADVDDEEAARIAADAALTNAISAAVAAEAIARAADVDDEEAARILALGTESATRQAADVALDVRLDTLEAIRPGKLLAVRRELVAVNVSTVEVSILTGGVIPLAALDLAAGEACEIDVFVRTVNNNGAAANRAVTLSVTLGGVYLGTGNTAAFGTNAAERGLLLRIVGYMVSNVVQEWSAIFTQGNVNDAGVVNQTTLDGETTALDLTTPLDLDVRGTFSGVPGAGVQTMRPVMTLIKRIRGVA